MQILRLAVLLFLLGTPNVPADESIGRPANETELRAWLESMVWHHRFTTEEIEAATALSADEVRAALLRFDVTPENKPGREGDSLLVLPYPGGRHPRIGFLEGAIDPRRETKLSLFLPWDPSSYVVADVPEAIWSNLGLTYLAHTHIPTIWSERKIELAPLEWQRLSNGDLKMERTLPNGIRFGTQARPGTNILHLTMWLHNGTKQALTDLRVQNCVMLKAAAGFNAQTNTNKIFQAPFAAVRSEQGDRWIIEAWLPNHRSWGNPPVPCLHSDPRIPDVQPGETQRANGLIAFYSGTDLEGEFERLESLLGGSSPWRSAQ